MVQNNILGANMPLTLEQHFKYLADRHPDVQNLFSLWILLRNDLEDMLPQSRNIFVHYSLHDASHSRSVIRAIEHFLGDDRIAQLSATDTFMLLICAYAHDYGMAMTFNQIYDALGDPDFIHFLVAQQKQAHTLAEEEAQAIDNLLYYINEKRAKVDLQTQYFSIMLIMQMYLRPTHWKDVERIWGDFKGLLEGRLNQRFVQNGEGIIDICEAHGKSFQEVLKMNIRADGIVGDKYHPCFIAAMLRLGDLLDLDNGRFPRWFVNEVARDRGIIPQLSIMHFKKHEAITHLLVTPKRIEICASCGGKDGYEVASLVREWIEWLEKECTDQILNWSEITQNDFGRPPRISKKEVTVDGKVYTSENHKLQMRMSQDRVMNLLKGTNIYQDQYVGIRELVQNAIDASLLQLWYDITHNRYIGLGVTKDGHKFKNEEHEISDESDIKKEEMKLLEHSSKTISGIFSNYDVTVELIQDMVDQKVYVTVKDKGTGITPYDVKYMSEIGTSKEKNEHTVELMKDMPRWLKPSGIFGIGLQSVFQLTDTIEFYTRRPNEPERNIVFYSFGRNHGKIEIREVMPDLKGVFYDNAVPGTNVKIAIEPKKILSNKNEDPDQIEDHFLHYDTEFDTSDALHAIYVELSEVIEEKLQEYPYDYFNVYFHPMEKSKDGVLRKKKKRRVRCSYFAPQKDNNRGDITQKALYEKTILSFFQNKFFSPFSFAEDRAYYVDDMNCRIYQLEVREGKILETAEGVRFQLPKPVRNLYHFQYKFNPISNAESIYTLSVRRLRKEHAGFLYWDINIMDGKPMKYLNIDRDRLREGAIREEELHQVRKVILSRWCEYLIQRYQKLEQDRQERNKQAKAKYIKSGNEAEFIPEKGKNLYEKKPEALVSIALLFYQNVPEEQFRIFMEPYVGFIEKQDFTLMGENFCIEKLWARESIFQFSFSLPQELGIEVSQVEESSIREVEELSIHLETILSLPHRLVHIFKIFLKDAKNMCYHLKLGQTQSADGLDSISMDAAARLVDYSGAIDPDPSNTTECNIDSLVRKVFKPNKAFHHLLIPKYPKTFKRGRNFSMSVDHCIRWYLLSPFDRELTKQLGERIYKDNRENEVVAAEFKNIAVNYSIKSSQFKKCVEYVCKQRGEWAKAMGHVLPENFIKTVTTEYIEFVKDCCVTLIKNREFIKSQFKEDK